MKSKSKKEDQKMVDWNVLKKLMDSFPGSYVNGNFEFIANPKTNQYFLLENCETERDVKVKVIEWLSRAACKTQPYDSPAKNAKFNKEMQDCINNYLGTSFTEEDFMQIYQKYGNAVRHDETLKFVDSLKPASKDDEIEM